MTKSVSVSFNNQTITAFMHNDTPVVALKPICENMGLQWEAQLKRIKRHPVLSKGMSIMDTPSAGGEQQTSCLPLNMLNGWLFGIDSSRVKPEIKDTVIAYQEKCFEVLADYFGMGTPKRITINTHQARAIQQAVNRLVHKTGKDYRTIYNEYKTAFNVAKYDDLPVEQFPAACEYLGVTYTGEFIAATDAPKAIEAPTPVPSIAPDFKIERDSNWHTNFQQGQEAVNEIRLAVCTGDAKRLDSVKYALRNAQAQIYKIDYCANGIDTGYIDMLSRYAIIGMQACHAPLLANRI